MGLGVATKAFFKLLFDRELSRSFQGLLDGAPPNRLTDSKASEEPVKPLQKEKPANTRSEAISLLAALQRETRLLDIVHESLDDYSDAQVGAAARDVLRDVGTVIQRMFAIEPMTDTPDGQSLETPAEFEPAEFRLTGKISGQAPFQGTVAHHGWKATRCEIPRWTGDDRTALIIAPVELEVG